MSDLIERLRSMRPDFIKESGEIMQEAADEIERLQKHLEACSDTCGFQARQIERLRAALESIANNTCCEGCQEAKRVARAALENDHE